MKLSDLEFFRFSMLTLKQSRQMNIQECGNVTLVEQTDMAEVDRLLKEH